MDRETYERETQYHIDRVRYFLQRIMLYISIRSEGHDASKFHLPEREGYMRISEKLRGVEYGTHEYAAALASEREAIEHHYAHNRHHPQHFKNGIGDMNMIDILEMLCDWRARHDDAHGSFADFLEVQQERYGFSDQLLRVMQNTAEYAGW